MRKHITCAECRFATVDEKASEYTRKRCKGCDMDSECTCRKRDCMCGKGCAYKNTDDVCPRQELRWAAIQCACSDSDYHRALLNVTKGGDQQEHISWIGCEYGERGCVL